MKFTSIVTACKHTSDTNVDGQIKTLVLSSFGLQPMMDRVEDYGNHPNTAKLMYDPAVEQVVVYRGLKVV